jgi:hypothetical protein
MAQSSESAKEGELRKGGLKHGLSSMNGVGQQAAHPFGHQTSELVKQINKSRSGVPVADWDPNSADTCIFGEGFGDATFSKRYWFKLSPASFVVPALDFVSC